MKTYILHHDITAPFSSASVWRSLPKLPPSPSAPPSTSHVSIEGKRSTGNVLHVVKGSGDLPPSEGLTFVQFEFSFVLDENETLPPCGRCRSHD